MEKRQAASRDICVSMKQIGISEWREKSLILTSEEQLEVYKSIRENVSTPLLEVVKLPYPKFVSEYYLRFYRDCLEIREKLNPIMAVQKFINADLLRNDLSLGYKMYLLPDYLLQFVDTYIKNPILTQRDFPSRYVSEACYLSLCDLVRTPLDESMRLSIQLGTNNEFIRRYIYIMQYVDAQEAEKMNLTTYTFLKQGVYRGFDLEKKVNSLNELERLALGMYLGFDGYSKNTTSTIAEYLNIAKDRFVFLHTKDFLFALAKSAKEFQNAIGYIDNDYEKGERISYRFNSPYSLKARLFEANFVIRNIDSEELMEIKSKRNPIISLEERLADRVPELLSDIQEKPMSPVKTNAL